MGDSIRLCRPSLDLESEYVAFYEDWVKSGEDMVPWVISREPYDFKGMLAFLLDNEKADRVPEGWVPSSTYWLVTDSQKVVGVVNIRHSLTRKLFETGGHIGYGIRPSERRKGYASQLLALALHQARELGIQRALLVCDEKNVGSEKTIRKNGGIHDTRFVEENGNVILRFWIQL